MSAIEKQAEQNKHGLPSFFKPKTTSTPLPTNYSAQRHSSMPNIHQDSAQPDIQPSTISFAGRLGGVQEFVLDRSDAANADVLARVPDAAPLMTVREALELRGFAQPELWKAAIIEGIGSLMLIYLTAWIGSHPAGPPPEPRTPAGVFATTSFFGPLIGGITSWIIVTIFIYALSAISGAHLNPMITIATFCARLTSLPRMVLYVAFQTIGAALAGLMLRASYNSRHFDVGGCSVDTSLVSVGEAYSVEFMCSTILLFLVFGVGLDPRQREIFGPTMAPALVGLVLGVISFGSAFARPGYQGASMNPARCFGVYIATRFPGYHWIHWVGPIVASVVHGLFYFLIPPWKVNN